ncbi:hypothetical protein [Aureimonas sp. SK2]|uniref:hypothetical protein n=1 Tax=Aureimonas sp. SK2 TaxID=3015992 RepID=UPI002443D452|nr:hypothetical protein [Aureimonas sp. SK2]
MSRYRIETGRVDGSAWVPGPFHDAINAVTDQQAVGAVREVLTRSGFADDWGDHARVLDGERHEIARLPLDQGFWAGGNA